MLVIIVVVCALQVFLFIPYSNDHVHIFFRYSGLTALTVYVHMYVYLYMYMSQYLYGNYIINGCESVCTCGLSSHVKNI